MNPNTPSAVEPIRWDLPAPPPDLAEQLSLLALPVQPFVRSFWSAADAREARALTPIVQHAKGPLGPWAFLAARPLKRAAGRQYAPLAEGSTPSPGNFDMQALSDHLGLRWMLSRQGNLAKNLLAQGCPPAFFFAQSFDPQSLPSPEFCGRALCGLGSKASHDAVKALFNAFYALESTREQFRSGVLHGVAQAACAIWTNRPGLANRAEASAVLNLAPILDRLARKKALPPELQTLADAVQAKGASARGKLDEEASFSFSDIQLRRQRAMASLAASDDAEAVEAMLGLCGLDQPEAFASGISKTLELGLPGLYWASAHSQRDNYACAALFVECGDNPWLMAGDGPLGQKASANPFLWLAIHSPPKDGAISAFSRFAHAFCAAALRDAETRSPGSGRKLCLQKLEDAKAHPLWPKDSSLLPPILAATEHILLHAHLEANDSMPAVHEPHRPRPRL